MQLASGSNPPNGLSRAVARLSYLRDSIDHSYADRLLRKPRRPHNRLHPEHIQLVHSLRLRPAKLTWWTSRYCQLPSAFPCGQAQFAPMQTLARTPTREPLATTVPASQFANDSSLF